MAERLDAVGPYQVVGELGAGGMGSVYHAKDPMIGRPVAIELILGSLDNAELLRRFEQEARSPGNLSHRNIVTIHSVGHHGAQPFIVMEYIRGRTLSDITAEQSVLPLSEKLRIIEQLCAGLAYAHAAGVIHRDIKPGNVIVDGEGTVKILDFGLARIADAALTQGHALMGTLPYMSPEQYAGSGVDHRSDVFAVGAVFYELLTYRRAFPGTLEDGIMLRVLNSHPEPVSRYCPDIDPEIEAIVNRCLAKNPATRYESFRVAGTPAWPVGRLAALGACRYFHHGLPSGGRWADSEPFADGRLRVRSGRRWPLMFQARSSFNGRAAQWPNTPRTPVMHPRGT